MMALTFLSVVLLALTSQFPGYVDSSVKLSHVSTIYLPYDITSGQLKYNLFSVTVEQLTYHVKDKLIYVVGSEILHVVNATNTTNLVREYSMTIPDYDVTDIEICGDFLFVTVDNMLNKMEGQMRVYRKYMKGSNQSLELIQEVPIGSLPDMVHPRPDCKSAVVALEAEAYSLQNGTIVDPEGAIVIVHFPDGVEKSKQVVKNLNFRGYNDRYQELEPKGVRFVYRENKNPFSADIEPEYIAIDEKSNKAYACLQENNGIAEVDLKTEKITKIHGLGFKEWGHLDASDRDGGIRITYWPIRAWYLPDVIHFHHWKGHDLVFSANEGDTKEYGTVDFDETIRGTDIYIHKFTSDIPKLVQTATRDTTKLGKLKFSAVDGRDGNGTFNALYTYGGRSFSIWDAKNNFQRLYDSGSSIEETTALHCPHLFNTNGQGIDGRSDNKGPETESLALAELGDRLYIFLGNERPGTISVYSIGDDVTDVRFEQVFCDGIPDDNRTIEKLFDDRDLYAVDPEDLKFYDTPDSPADFPILIVAGTVSGTVSILKVEHTDEPSIPDIPKQAPCSNDQGNSAVVIGVNAMAIVFMQLCVWISVVLK